MGSQQQKSMKALYVNQKKLLSDKEKIKYGQRLKMQQSQAESNEINEIKTIALKITIQNAKIEHLKNKKYEVEKHQENKQKRDKVIQK